MIFLVALDLLFQNMTLVFSSGELRYLTFSDICLIFSYDMIEILSVMSDMV